MSTTWVITSKMVHGTMTTKARLVVRGYEEDEKVRSDSPTCNKENIRALLAIAVANDWSIKALDIKAAFLQGKSIDRDLYIKPPKECRKENVIWKLKKVVYGLTDASRSWYLRVNEVLDKLGMKKSSIDNAVYTFGESELEGVMIIHVDDVLYFGSEKFLKEVIVPFKNTFKISREESTAFKYVGIDMCQSQDSIILQQKDYLESMNADLVAPSLLKEKLRFAMDEEKKQFRQGVGQLGWITNISRPETAFSFCTLSTVQRNPQMADFAKFKKAVKDMKMTDSFIKINKIAKSDFNIAVYSDASYGNLTDGSSQIGFIVFLYDKNGRSAPISWASKKAKRVARSTITAETLAATEAVDNAIVLKKMIGETTRREIGPITLYVDNKSLHDAVQTTNVLTERRLLIDMAALREMVDRQELVVKWLTTENQLADVLTKQGVNKQKLISVLTSGRLPIEH